MIVAEGGEDLAWVSAAIEVGIDRPFMVLSSWEQSSSACLFVPSVQNCRFKKLNAKHRQLLYVLTSSLHLHSDKGMKLTQCLCSRPFQRSLTHPRRCASALHCSPCLQQSLLSTAKVHPHPFCHPITAPDTEGLVLLMSKGIPPYLTASVTWPLSSHVSDVIKMKASSVSKVFTGAQVSQMVFITRMASLIL